MLPNRLSNIHGLKIVSDVKSPIVFLGLKNSTGSLKSDSQLLEHIAEQFWQCASWLITLVLGKPFSGYVYIVWHHDHLPTQSRGLNVVMKEHNLS
ncbi:hypothetical protein CsSME_00011149 [Camellia sinensis var. sinensis]